MSKSKVPVLDKADDALFSLYKNMCGLCGHRVARAIHELIPRSRAPKDWWLSENRVPVCVACHSNAHDEGAYRQADSLGDRRNKVLIRFGVVETPEELEELFTEMDKEYKL